MHTVRSRCAFRPVRIEQLLVALFLAMLLLLLLTYSANAASNGLDPDFGNGGVVTTTIQDGGNVQAIVIQSDGKIVAAGSYNSVEESTNFALARYNPDGTLDDSFGGDGIVTTAVSDFGAVDAANDLALQDDGKLVAAGLMDRDRITLPTFFAVVRYNTDGSLDQTFDEDGTATTGSPGEELAAAYAVAIQEDAKIVAAGYMDDQGVLVALVRYNANGTLDENFGIGGIVTTTFAISNSSSSAQSLLVQPDQKLVIAGYATHGGSSLEHYDTALARYNPDGTLDDSFGIGGLVTTPVMSEYYDLANDVVVQTDGKLVVAGTADMGGTEENYVAARQDIVLIRYNSNGTLDPDFGNGGIVTTSVASAGFDDAHSLVLQADGKIVVAGAAEISDTGSDFVLLRYNTDGSLDMSFGEAGIQTRAITPGSVRDQARAVALYEEDKWLVGGFTQGAFALARFDNIPSEPMPTDTQLYLPALRQVSQNRQQRLER